MILFSFFSIIGMGKRHVYCPNLDLLLSLRFTYLFWAEGLASFPSGLSSFDFHVNLFDCFGLMFSGEVQP
jgi:hypothetical protein